MDFEWVAIALGDVTWITLAFPLGFLARLINLPPLVGELEEVIHQLPEDRPQLFRVGVLEVLVTSLANARSASLPPQNW